MYDPRTDNTQYIYSQRVQSQTICKAFNIHRDLVISPHHVTKVHKQSAGMYICLTPLLLNPLSPIPPGSYDTSAYRLVNRHSAVYKAEDGRTSNNRKAIIIICQRRVYNVFRLRKSRFTSECRGCPNTRKFKLGVFDTQRINRCTKTEKEKREKVCGQLILRKINKVRATMCQILRLKYIKFVFRWGPAPDPAEAADSAPPNSLAVSV